MNTEFNKMMNVSKADDQDRNKTAYALFGLTEDELWYTQVYGIACATVSDIVSFYVLFTFWRNRRTFWNQPIGERLALYLAISDVLFSTSSIYNFGLLLDYDGRPPAGPCDLAGYLSYTLVLYPVGFLMFNAINACATVVKEKKLETGKYDWKLLLPVFLIPSLVDAPFLFVDFYGNTGSWCGHDVELNYAYLTFAIMGGAMTLVFLINLTCYLTVAIKIISSARNLHREKKQQQNHPNNQALTTTNPLVKYRRTLRTMLVYMFVYILQYGAIHVDYIDNFFGVTNFYVSLGVTVCVNIGGILNYVAYTVIRRRSPSVNPQSSGLPPSNSNPRERS